MFPQLVMGKVSLWVQKENKMRLFCNSRENSDDFFPLCEIVAELNLSSFSRRAAKAIS